MNAVKNNWKHGVWCRLLQCSHFIVPCKYCITETPTVSCRLGIPHNSETSTLTENLSQDQIITRVSTLLPWTGLLFGWFQFQLFVLVFLVEKTKLAISLNNSCPVLFWGFLSFLCVSVFSSFFTDDTHKEGEKKCQRSHIPCCKWCWCEEQQMVHLKES